MTTMTRDVIDWAIRFGILPTAVYEVEWDDLLARSDEERLDNSNKMAATNRENFLAGQGEVFTEQEIREAAGFEPDAELDPVDESLPDDDEGDGE